ncbi:hypothetical protein BD324DRAFT_679962 [Kockovaella imperatae]|uniref:Uncharacterized protein n=1 Tax=Kockovaella imperatae TaxID=4999 RepID=A0A1Y1UJP3_9TREE|nr:hypothetical protein BD324DRAFT_679962 [Kockovaella imperatae]ORX38202.1 hypothetical protein BD324DRAFT_679962 [Kockovaella imperatae]
MSYIPRNRFQASDCLEGHVLIGVFLSVSSIVVLCLTSFSIPYIKNIFFLSTSTGYKYGTLGYCQFGSCSRRRIGYETGREIIHWLTQTLVLFPIAALLIFLGLWGLVWSLWGPSKNSIWFRIPTAVGALTALVAEIFALVLFVTARNRFHESAIDTAYGPALWLGIAGFICAATSAFFCGPPYTARYMYRAHRDYPTRY